MVKEYGYEYEAARKEALWEETKGKTTDQLLCGAHCLCSGRDALKAIAREFKPCTVLVPALACDSMLFPFRLYGHTVRFYRQNRDYSVDLDSVIIDEKQTLFLYMDYFGRPAVNDKELEKLRNRGNIVFIEDRTHNLLWDRQSAFQPDYIMASLRKWLPIPDGGLLWGNITGKYEDDTSFSAARLKAQCMRWEYLRCGDDRLKIEFRRTFSTVSEMLNQKKPTAMSAYSFELAKTTDLDLLRTVRKRNAESLISILSRSPLINLIQDKAGLSDLYVAFLVPRRDEVQNRLSTIGIFNTIIWPLAEAQKQYCETAAFTQEHMLAAPCDQRYTTDDMEFIGKEIVRIVEDVNR